MELGRYADTRFGRPIRTPGRHGYVAYMPRAIPRSLEISTENIVLLGDAEAALGRLAGAGRLLPAPELLVGQYLRREAVASTRIEGTRATLVEVLDNEATGRPPSADVEEVINYVHAMRFGLDRIQALPLSSRLLREIHATLLSGVRGRERTPGQFRTTQNWIGSGAATLETATFVPPLPDEVGQLLDDLELFIHEPTELPLLVKTALLHYQFETIHPFLDGNGRLGRLLIVFFLIWSDRIPAPLLYLSPYLEQHRQSYYDGLQTVRETGHFDPWLNLLLRAIAEQANDAVARAEQLLDVRERYRVEVQSETRGSANQVVDLLFESPVLTTRLVEERLAITRPSANTALKQLESLGILGQLTDTGDRGQIVWQAPEVLAALTEQDPIDLGVRPLSD